MPEVILPCHASMSDAELLKLKHRFDDVCQSSATPELFELCRAGSHLVDALRTLPSALTWTHEPPKVAGKYWWRPAGKKIGRIRDMFVRNGEVGFLDHNDRFIKDIGDGEWAGPIPAPIG